MKRRNMSFSTISRNRYVRKAGLFCGVVVVAGMLTMALLHNPSEDEKGQVEERSTVRPVTVKVVQPGTYQASIVGYGEVNSEWKVDLRSKVQGEVVELSERFRIGNKVEKGEVLLLLDPIESEVLLAEAEFSLNKARVDFLIEENERAEALESWRRSGFGKPPASPLVLREPYLEMAKTNLKVAETALIQAQKQLSYTKVRVPFDALIVSRSVSLGGELFAGDEVCTLIGTQKSVIAIHVDKHQWVHFPEHWEGGNVDIRDIELDQAWIGKLVREGQFFDPETRLRTLFVEVEEPLSYADPLLPGNFVEVRFRGKPVDGLLRIPESARNQKGFIWLVEEGHLLNSYAVVPEFQRDGYLFVKNPVQGEAVVVIYPNNSFVNGLKVTPSEKEL